MKSNFPQKQLLLSLLLLALSCAGFLIFYSKVKSNNNNTEEIFAKWETEYNKREKIKSLNDFIKNTSEERVLLYTHFAQSSNVVPFLDTVEDLGQKVDAKVEVISVNVPTDANFLELEVKVSGNFEAIYKFIKLLENSPYEVEIMSFNLAKISPSAISKEPLRWSANLELKLLSFIK